MSDEISRERRAMSQLSNLRGMRGAVGSWANVVLLLIVQVVALAPHAQALADEQTAGEFLTQCDRLDPGCRNEFVAGLQAVYVGQLACPPRIDVNTPITPWLDYMHRRVVESPSVANNEKNRLQLEAFMHLWPCPKK